MVKSLIRWKRGDYISLGKAVSNFNKKRQELLQLSNDVNVPDEINYAELKENILTRNELKRQVNKLKRFMREDAIDIVIEDNTGDVITKWEKNERNIAKRTASRRLNTQLASIDKNMYPYETVQERTIKGLLNHLPNFDSDYLSYLARSDIDVKRAKTYQENYLQFLKTEYKNYKNYDVIMNLVQSYSNPIAFYENIKGNEILRNINTQYSQSYTQEQFNKFISDVANELGQDIELEG